MHECMNACETDVRGDKVLARAKDGCRAMVATRATQSHEVVMDGIMDDVYVVSSYSQPVIEVEAQQSILVDAPNALDFLLLFSASSVHRWSDAGAIMGTRHTKGVIVFENSSASLVFLNPRPPWQTLFGGGT